MAGCSLRDRGHGHRKSGHARDEETIGNDRGILRRIIRLWLSVATIVVIICRVATLHRRILIVADFGLAMGATMVAGYFHSHDTRLQGKIEPSDEHDAGSTAHPGLVSVPCFSEDLHLANR
jgi:Flp pilus assembly protein TadB